MAKMRISWLDGARTMAIIFVVLCHAVENNFWSVMIGNETVSVVSWIFQCVLYTFGRLGVPIFLMISGSLLLGREYEPNRFYKYSLLPLIITYEVWIVIYYIFNLVINAIPFNFKDLLSQVLFLSDTGFNHTWYMYVLIGIYISVPLISRMVSSFSLKQMEIPIISVFILSFIFPFYNIFAEDVITFLPNISSQITLPFLGGTYGFYFILGYYIKEGVSVLEKTKFQNLLIWFGIVFSACVSLGYALYWLSSDVVTSFFWYTNPFICICAVLLFQILKRINISSVITETIAKCSFSIYLMHNVVLQVFNSSFADVTWYIRSAIWIKILIGFVISFATSLIIAIIANRTLDERIKKTLFFIK